MDLQKIVRIPKRIKQDLQIIGLAKNWKEILASKLSGKPLRTVRLRNGIIMNAPAEVDLGFLFHEIWLDKFYEPPGYTIAANERLVDIGGNIGVFAFYAATRARGIVVDSFEPFPQNAKYFVDNQKASALRNVTFHEAAVAGKNGTRTLHVEDSWLLHSLTDKTLQKKVLVFAAYRSMISWQTVIDAIF